MIEFLPLEQKKFYGIIVPVAFFFTPLIVILVAYGTIFHIARAHARGRGVSSFKKVLCYAIVIAIAIDSQRNSPLDRTVCMIIITCAFSRLYPVLNGSDHSPCFGNMFQSH